MPFLPSNVDVALMLALFIHVTVATASVSKGSSSSSIISAGNAALGACLPSAPHDIALAQTRLRQRLRGKDNVMQSEGSSSQMLDSISSEILALQEELDDAHLVCQADKRVNKAKVAILANSNSQVAQDVGSIEAKIAAFNSELQPTTEKIQSLRDQMQQMRSECEKDGKALKTDQAPQLLRVMKAQRLETKCRNGVRTMNDNLRERVSHLAKSQVALTQSVAMKTGFQQQMKEADAHMKKIMKRAEEFASDCQESSEQFQREMCGLIEMRQSVYWKFVAGNQNKVIQDCKVSDWTAEQCSKPCIQTKDEPSGTQKLTRKFVMAGSRYGAPCPALNRTVTCNEGVMCPVDCKMTEWTGWAKCSRKCGGGEQYRTRSVQQAAVSNGAVCGVTAQSKLCNVGACQSSCTFGAWSPWGACSKRCKWSKSSPAGHSSRKRPVLTESKPGACKAEDARQIQKCNGQTCSRDPDKLKCNSPHDILVVLDGSESIESDGDSAFKSAKNLVKGLVEHSSFSGDGDLVRYALMLFGAARPQLLAPMSGDKQSLLTKLAAAPFNNGYSNVAEALASAVQVSQLATAGDRPLRPETLFLITGNSLRNNVATATAARKLRAVGVRIIVLQVRDIKDPIVQGDESVCQLASAPCADNWVRVESWDEVGDPTSLAKYLSTVCPLKGDA